MNCTKVKKCDQCEALMINGVFCHETGCLDAWKGTPRECKWCGLDFVPEVREQKFCDDQCYQIYYNL